MRHWGDGRTTVRESANRMYSAGQEIWSSGDLWHQHMRRQIEAFVLRHGKPLLELSPAILDAGCGRDSYSWMPPHTTNLDYFYEQVSEKQHAVVGDVKALPFVPSAFDLVFCIGSVLNYVSAFEAIAELARVCKPGAHLFLQFESSSSFEQIFRSSWNAPAHLNRTVNAGRTDHIWIYSPSYIFDVLKQVGFRVVDSNRFHILPALLTRIGVGHGRAAAIAKSDEFFPWLGLFADNVILLAERI
jgi:SAM-dependent methyltransferase